jgi:hypothetical protein
MLPCVTFGAVHGIAIVIEPAADAFNGVFFLIDLFIY